MSLHPIPPPHTSLWNKTFRHLYILHCQLSNLKVSFALVLAASDSSPRFQTSMAPTTNVTVAIPTPSVSEAAFTLRYFDHDCPPSRPNPDISGIGVYQTISIEII